MIALAKGGALEIVPEFGGLLYDDPEGLLQAIERWEEFDAEPDPPRCKHTRLNSQRAEFARQMKSDPV